jgi:hypothetical protein
MKSKIYFLALISLIGLSGCIGSGNMTQVRNDLDEQLTGVRFKRVVGIQTGPLTLGLARFVTSFIDDAREARSLMRTVTFAHVRVYEVIGRLKGQEVRTPRTLRDLQENGWNMLVKVREEDSNVWIMSHDRFGDVRDLYMVVMDDESLVMARVKGNFTELVTRAMQMDEHERMRKMLSVTHKSEQGTTHGNSTTINL